MVKSNRFFGTLFIAGDSSDSNLMDVCVIDGGLDVVVQAV